MRLSMAIAFRLSCDTIMNINEEEIVEAYMASTEVPYKKKLCGKFCKKAKMVCLFLLPANVPCFGDWLELL